MKELTMETIEEKARAYDKALEVLHKYDGANIMFTQDLKEEMFPELKESWGEKMGAMAIKAVHSPEAQSCIKSWGINPDDVIAWIEKQTVQSNFLSEIRVGDKVTRNEDGELVNISQMERTKKPTMAEMIKNLKPVSEVLEQNFKIEEGKWYVCTQTFNSRGKNVVIKGQAYKSNQDGAVEGEDGWLFIDKVDGKAFDYLKPWSVEDAKDGDVLSYNDGSLTIFHYRLSGLDAGLYMSYVLLTELKIEFKQTCTISNVCPATKKQRDTLMKAIADAGYTFDFEKKDLKKVETPKLTEFEEEIKDMMDDYKDAIGENDATVEEVKERAAYLLSLIPQKPAWSEEDERKLSLLDALCDDQINGSTSDSTIYREMHELKEWIKFLKDRVQPQREWSEEDDNCLSTIIAEFSKCSGKSVSKDEWMRCNDFLNSLKDRVQIKPQQEWSEEDNKMCKAIIDNIQAICEEGYFVGNIGSDKLVDWLKFLKDKVQSQNITVTDEELAQAKKDAYNDALDKIEYHSGEPTFDDGWSAAIWYLKKRINHEKREIYCRNRNA